MITTEFMILEITLISLLTGMLIGFVGGILAVKVMTRIGILEDKARKYDEIEQRVADEITPKGGGE